MSEPSTYRLPTRNELDIIREAMVAALSGMGRQIDVYWLSISESFCRVHGLKPILPELNECRNGLNGLP